jgi:hypothetical protein
MQLRRRDGWTAARCVAPGASGIPRVAAILGTVDPAFKGGAAFSRSPSIFESLSLILLKCLFQDRVARPQNMNGDVRFVMGPKRTVAPALARSTLSYFRLKTCHDNFGFARNKSRPRRRRRARLHPPGRLGAEAVAPFVDRSAGRCH